MNVRQTLIHSLIFVTVCKLILSDYTAKGNRKYISFLLKYGLKAT